ncbi:histidinol-phosphate transaminase [Arcanobacterium bovis]|uniref:Aminotransferase class I/II-fold pyridoxal phosphate-dependent enzyme n=1 Tax=Arcanobacterium bovis TaxID=2529275 RepID=A0A4Q9UZI9_9ACTO|nr:histidinol-phosphate transaminase [Arcanobacterium bovis]TBW21101.1 aminotransferase class I/II-fold pyridoxal phosphate-dependent enzyme [Arcanobacterium bovis]
MEFAASPFESFFRPEIYDLPAYVAGKRACESGVIKLASNESPFPTLPAVQAAIQAHLGDVNRYPDMANSLLTSKIAQFHQLDESYVTISNGSVALIEKILSAICTPNSQVVLPWRSFEAYPIAVSMAGAQAVKVPLRADGNPDLVAMLGEINARTRAIIVCTPNNPTSSALNHTELRDFLLQVPPHIPVLLDEAYVEYVEMDDAVRGVELVKECANVISLRTFSKAYGLAGLRCGYALAQPHISQILLKCLTPFGTNTLAQVAAVAALDSVTEVRRRVEITKQERANVVNALCALGWRGGSPQGNFVWFNLRDEIDGASQRFTALCEDEGITVRTFRGEGSRVTIAEPEGSLRLIRAYSAFRRI